MAEATSADVQGLVKAARRQLILDDMGRILGAVEARDPHQARSLQRLTAAVTYP